MEKFQFMAGSITMICHKSINRYPKMTPSGNDCYTTMEMTIYNGKSHYKWSFSIATLNYQRVTQMIKS